ncbi:uncharacterized protein Z518_01365 [Rhinocladiella mackenziei CBS 650.93]|uniref:Rhinocladiella mackenziei CBS 650.93 unplaced genomic scaffold supercont1.1, whole genome shotgun sequence n=1 Tax=Rhinocladiella mackenziei CBS 650.93 TaxID=1442369 RepID=A0A0D2HHW1_9EURO|nr:uncharacterized protein Z518_01365 [Rhinocladiella mackenziei CBS 650.93]KIX10283.1 hypothetical protein Z518_01365 [Rhinocladiella mackenziei CBS 650.93]
MTKITVHRRGIRARPQTRTDLSLPATDFSESYSAVFQIDGHRYIIYGLANKAVTIPYHSRPSLVSVIHLSNNQTVEREFLRQKIQEYQSEDDVFHFKFLQGVIFTVAIHDRPEKLISPDALALLKLWGNEWCEALDGENEKSLPAPGVYFASRNRLLPVYKLYDDHQGAFLTSLIPSAQSPHTPIKIAGKEMQTGVVAVPSRLQKRPTRSQPLLGLRIAVKDNFQIEGIRASLGSRAYYDLYPPPDRTACCIAKLEKGGAYILGTTKMSSFAATEEPVECIDYQAPWNPRADEYQSPAGSSSGSAAAISSYKWLDIAIGSDSNGSGRRPAHWSGCFALRPSHGVLDAEGFVPSFRLFDTPTFFGRDIHKCRAFAAAWYGENLPNPIPNLPLKIIVATDYLNVIANRAQLEVIEKFVKDLEQSLGVQRQNVSFDESWDSSPPVEAEGQVLSDFMKHACRNSFFHDDYHSLDSFREDYSEKYSKMPYVSPPVRKQWDLSSKISTEERNEAVRRLAVYKDWFAREILELGRKTTLVILPIENMSPRYRDEATTNFDPVGVPMLFLSPILGGPELVVPAGQVPYLTRGTDLKLLDVAANCLEQSARPTEVAVGKTMF